jgi:hypothetical protein
MGIFDKIFKKGRNNGQKSQHKPGHHIPDFDKYDDFGQIVQLFDYVLYSDLVVANKAAETIHRLFGTICLFKSNQPYRIFRFLEIDQAAIQRFNRFDFETKVTLLCIASMNGNGYSREAALEKLDKIGTQRVIPFILFRLADWVIPVRNKAEAIVKSLIAEENILYFIQNHTLINWLIQVERTDLSGLFNGIANLITSKPLKPDDYEKLSDSERFFYCMSFAREGKLNNALVYQMLNDKYYLIRIIVVKNLDKVPDISDVLTKLLSDKSQKVRQGAINHIYNQNLEADEELLKGLIFEKSSTVRYVSRKLLDKIGKHDFKTLYQAKIKENSQLIGSILGLAETGGKSDIEIIRPFLASEKAKVKSAALSAIYKLDNELATEIAYQIIASNNPGSTKNFAGQILSKQGIDYDMLRKIYDTTDIAGKKVILRLFAKFGGWTVAGDFFKALTENDETLTPLAKKFIEQWNFYTIGLATKQKTADKEYVLMWYNKAKGMGLHVPDNIPFIFGEK